MESNPIHAFENHHSGGSTGLLVVLRLGRLLALLDIPHAVRHYFSGKLPFDGSPDIGSPS